MGGGIIGDDLITEPEPPKSGEVDQVYLSNSWEIMTGEGGSLDVIDHICPGCHKNINWQLWAATYCPHCGTPIFGAKRRKLDAEMRGNWSASDIRSLEAYHGKRGTGTRRSRKQASISGSGPTAKRELSKYKAP